MPDELLELSRLRADLPPADEAKMARARAALVHTATAVPTRRRRFPVRIAATAVAGAAVVAAFVIVPSVGDNAPAASAVTFNDDGTVSVLTTDLFDIDAANRQLKDKGVPAELIAPSPTGSCEPGTELGDPLAMPDGLLVTDEVPDHVIIFRPDRIPAGTTLVMFAAAGTYTVFDIEPAEDGVEGDTMHVKPFVPSELHPEGTGTCVTYPLR